MMMMESNNIIMISMAKRDKQVSALYCSISFQLSSTLWTIIVPYQREKYCLNMDLLYDCYYIESLYSSSTHYKSKGSSRDKLDGFNNLTVSILDNGTLVAAEDGDDL
jgi:hypothetical protein